MKVTLQELKDIVKDEDALKDLKLVELDTEKKYLLVIKDASPQMVENFSVATTRLGVSGLIIANTAIHEAMKVFELERES